MSGNDSTPEVAAIEAKIQAWLQQNQNKFQLDLTQNPLEFKKHSDTLFSASQDQLYITLGFNEAGLNQNSTLADFQSAFNFVALDKLPLPGLDGIPPQWKLRPQTPMSSFSDGVTLEKYDPSTQTLKLTIQTNFFAVYGNIPQEHPIMDAPAPKGTYLQVRQDFQGDIQLNAKLDFSE